MLDVSADADLIRRCLQHDEDAWRALVGRYSGYIYSIATRAYGFDREEAGEVFQESLLHVFEGLPKYRNEGPFRAWLRQIVRNCCAAHLRSRRVSQALDETVVDPAQEELLERVERAHVLTQALRDLDTSCQRIVALFFFERQSYAAIAALLEDPAGTVASRLARCLTKLRRKKIHF